MGDKTKIEWTATHNADGTVTPGSTWNPMRGCSRVSEGCRNCYAERVAARFSGVGQPYEGLIRNGRWNGVTRFVPEKLTEPLHWTRPRRIFVDSMSDLFHESVDELDIWRVFGIMALARQHTFQILTKRSGRMLELMTRRSIGSMTDAQEQTISFAEHYGRERWPGFVFDSRGSDQWKYTNTTAERVKNRRPWPGWPLPNVHLGVSIEDQGCIDRARDLCATPAALRFVSAEPLLGPLDLSGFLGTGPNQIGWLISGGESGPGARAAHPDWHRSLRDQCKASGVPLFFKQHGDWLSVGDLDDTGPKVQPRDVSYVWPDGERSHLGYPERSVRDAVLMVRVGKKGAGRLLDGVEHSGFPEATGG